MEHSNLNNSTFNYSNSPWTVDEKQDSTPVTFRVHPDYLKHPHCNVDHALEETTNLVLEMVVEAFYRGDFNYEHTLFPSLGEACLFTLKVWEDFIRHHLHWPVACIASLFEVIYFAGVEQYGASYNDMYLDHGVLDELLKQLTPRTSKADFDFNLIKTAIQSANVQER